MTRWDTILWGVLPYVAIAVFLVGHWWRYAHDQYRWGARSTQLLESRTLRYASNLFHFGALGAIGGHVVGILVPHSLTSALGIGEGTYHFIAGVGGVTAGAAATVGFFMLVWRRARFPRVRVTTSRADVLAFALLAVSILTGMWATLHGTLGTEVRYRDSVAPWFRSLFVLDPRPGLMANGVPFVFQLHVTAAWALYAAWPWTRLVHAWSIPVDWFRRSPIPYRGRDSRRAAARTAGSTATAAGAARSGR